MITTFAVLLFAVFATIAFISTGDPFLSVLMGFGVALMFLGLVAAQVSAVPDR